MNFPFRLFQSFQLCAGLFILFGSPTPINRILALMMIGSALYCLLTPTPQQKVESEIDQLKQQGIYPQGHPTDEDVRRVLEAGYKGIALRLYRQIHDVPLKQALHDVNQISKT